MTNTAVSNTAAANTTTVSSVVTTTVAIASMTTGSGTTGAPQTATTTVASNSSGNGFGMGTGMGNGNGNGNGMSSSASMSASSAGGSGGAPSGGAGGNGGNTASGTDGGSTGAPRSMGYVGCSMSVNVTQGYEALGAERLWPPIGTYNGKVVQNWANTNDSAWGAFEQAMGQYGTPTAVWVMLCIFNNMVSTEETRQIIANVRERAPDATIYITGQPLYEQGLSCDLAGQGGPELTDERAQEAAADPALDVIYAGIFGPLNSSQRQDSCHANAQGQQFLGQQAIEKWGE